MSRWAYSNQEPANFTSVQRATQTLTLHFEWEEEKEKRESKNSEVVHPPLKIPAWSFVQFKKRAPPRGPLEEDAENF